ncbi:hypothetical protein LZ30DRAFT_258713 [Colletotrichum cereale]|nr:hypothetical protein LZ30DRAFT_258713 [Colletotrichum cereale]
MASELGSWVVMDSRPSSPLAAGPRYEVLLIAADMVLYERRDQDRPASSCERDGRGLRERRSGWIRQSQFDMDRPFGACVLCDATCRRNDKWWLDKVDRRYEWLWPHGLHRRRSTLEIVGVGGKRAVTESRGKLTMAPPTRRAGQGRRRGR